MQTNNLVANKSAATANNVSPDSTTTQPPTEAQRGIDADLLKIIDDLVAEVRKCATNALIWRILVGVKLRDHRDGLNSDDWNQLLKSGRLPFSARTAQMLVRIGEHKILSNMKRAHQFPDSVTVLNEIAALPLSVAEQALADGTIHPGTTLAEAKALVAQHRAKKRAVPAQSLALRPL